MDRREFLAATGAGVVASVAGCSGALGSVAPPNVPENRLADEGWVLREESEQTVFEESYGPVTIVAKSHTLAYEDRALRKDVREKTLGEVDGQMAMFSATRIAFSPNLVDLPGSVATSEIVDRTEAAAREQFVSQMEAAGLRNVSRTETGSLEVAGGAEARLTTYEAEFPFGGVSFPVTDEESISLDGEPIAVAGDLAVWEADGSVLVAGGAYPAENLSRTLTEELSDAIAVTIDIDLGLEPETYRRNVRQLLRAVE